MATRDAINTLQLTVWPPDNRDSSSPIAQLVKKLLAIRETGVQLLGQEGNGNPLQYSCLENPVVRGACQATVHGVTRVGHD